MTRLVLLRRNEDGAAVIEFAIILPVLILLIWGIFQCALLFEANAGMQHALGEGARYATLYDTTTSDHIPSDTNIKAKMDAKLFGPNTGNFTVSNPSRGYLADGTTPAGYMTLTVSYTRTMDFLFFTGPSVTLTRSKKVYTVTNT